MIQMLPLSRARFVGALVALVVLAPASTPVFAQGGTPQLAELAPSSSYSLLQLRNDPSMQFAYDANAKFMAAVQDARLHELLVDAIDIARAQGGEDAAQIGALVELMTSLVASVDWEALVANEMIFVEAAVKPVPGAPPFLSSLLFASRPDADRVAELEQSLSGLLGAASGLTEDLVLSFEERPSGARLTSLHTVGDGQLNVMQLAVRDDVIMMGFGEQIFANALNILEGNSSQSLVRTRRYKEAVKVAPANTPSLMYFDTHQFLTWLGDFIPEYVAQQGAPPLVLAALHEVIGLADICDTAVTSTHGEGNDLIVESWTQFRQEAVDNDNPIYLATAGGEATGELLDFVPANALSFSLSQDTDLRPLYRWALERVEYYLPKASDNLLALVGIQAAMDLSIEDDLLSWLGSETITIAVPSKRFVGTVDTVMISRLRDPAGARKIISRCQAVFDALVPPLLERLKEELSWNRTPSPINKLTLSDSHGSFPSMKQLEVSLGVANLPIPMPPIPTITFGVVGNLLIFTTSEQAIETVFSVAAGEEDGLWEHPALQSGDRLESQVVASASLRPVGQQMREVAGALGLAAGTLGLMAPQGDASQTVDVKVIGLITKVMQKVSIILHSLDSVEDTVCYSERRNDGMTHYTHSSTRYRASDN